MKIIYKRYKIRKKRHKSDRTANDGTTIDETASFYVNEGEVIAMFTMKYFLN